jgi:hypothetical protein
MRIALYFLILLLISVTVTAQTDDLHALHGITTGSDLLANLSDCNNPTIPHAFNCGFEAL